MNIPSNDVFYTPQITCEKRRSIFDPELPTPVPAQNTDEAYKEKLEKEIKEWQRTLQRKYLRKKEITPRLQDETNLKLSEEQEIYLSQAPNFQQMIADRKEFVKTVEYYMNLRSHIVDDLEYRNKLLTSVANKAVRDIINKAIYE